MTDRKRNNIARLKSYYRDQLQELCPDHPRDMFSTLEELKQKVEAERAKKAPPIEHKQEQLDQFYTYKELLKKEEKKEQREKAGNLLYGRGGEIISVADPNPYVYVDDIIMTREKFEEKQRLEKEKNGVWRFA